MSHQHNTRKKSNAVVSSMNKSPTTSSVVNTAASLPSAKLPVPDLSSASHPSDGQKPPPLTPKPGAKLQDVVIRLEQEVNRLSRESLEKDEKMKKMEERIAHLEYEQTKHLSYFIIHENTTELLQQRISQLEQYTRRYSVIVKGIERPPGQEQHTVLAEEVKKIIESANSVPFTEVDKFHRNGPRRDDNDQDVIIRFKSHAAKESFYNSRKNLPNKNLKIQPSLSPERKKFLEKAREELKTYHGDAEAENYSNPPHFVLPDQHGNLLLKFEHKTKDGLFLRFNSLQELHGLIVKYNARAETETAYREEVGRIERGDGRAPYVRTNEESGDN